MTSKPKRYFAKCIHCYGLGWRLCRMDWYPCSYCEQTGKVPPVGQKKPAQEGSR